MKVKCKIVANNQAMTVEEFKASGLAADAANLIAVIITIGESSETYLVTKKVEDELPWRKAMEWAKDKDMQLPSRILATLIYDNKEQFNACARAIDGNEFNEWGWTNAEYSANYAFVYYGTNGGLYGYIKNNSLGVRGVLALEGDLKL